MRGATRLVGATSVYPDIVKAIFASLDASVGDFSLAIFLSGIEGSGRLCSDVLEGYFIFVPGVRKDRVRRNCHRISKILGLG